MGVDHSAFVSYVAKVRLNGDVTADDIDEWLSKSGKDLGLCYVELGSRQYGGDGGFVVGDKHFRPGVQTQDRRDSRRSIRDRWQRSVVDRRTYVLAPHPGARGDER